MDLTVEIPAEVVTDPEPTPVVDPPEPTVTLFTQAELDKEVEDRVAKARAEFTARIAADPEATIPSEKLYTKEELDQHEKVAANRTARKFADYSELKKKVEQFDGLVTKHNELSASFAATEAERDSLSTQVTRLEVAIEKKLPKELAVRLTGLTREEIEADASSLAQLTGTSAGGFGGGPAPTPSLQGTSFNEALRKAAGYAA